jgi:hypothetical protein
MQIAAATPLAEDNLTTPLALRAWAGTRSRTSGGWDGAEALEYNSALER